MKIPIQATIRQHTDAIISGYIAGPKGCCPRCFKKPKTFKLHECRRRSFRYIVGNFVKVIMTLLPRWKCSTCGKTFTIYPSFALPHKRYVLDDIKRLSKKYLENEQQTYCMAVTHGGSPIGYEEDDKNVDHFLAPSTPWRWIRWLGNIRSFEIQFPSSRDRKDQQNSIFYETPPIASKKYRNSRRLMIIQRVSAVLHAGQEFNQPIPRKFFPHLATSFSWNCCIYSFP